MNLHTWISPDIQYSESQKKKIDSLLEEIQTAYPLYIFDDKVFKFYGYQNKFFQDLTGQIIKTRTGKIYKVVALDHMQGRQPAPFAYAYMSVEGTCCTRYSLDVLDDEGIPINGIMHVDVDNTIKYMRNEFGYMRS